MAFWKTAARTSTNLCTNGGFETNTTGWGLNGAGVQSLTRVTTDSKFGAACALISVDGAAGGQGLIWNSTKADVTANAAYTISGWLKSVSGAVVAKVGVEWYTALDAYISNSESTPTITTSFARYTHTATAPGTAAYARIYFRANAAAAMAYRADGLQLELGSTATHYIETDGGTAARAVVLRPLNVSGFFGGARTGAA